MENRKGKEQKVNEHQQTIQRLVDRKLQPAASEFHVPSPKSKIYSKPVFQSAAIPMPKIPHEQITKCNYLETNEQFSLPSIQQLQQRSRQNSHRLSESSITSTESTPNKQIVTRLPFNLCGVNLPPVCNKQVKRPISKSNSSESSSDRSVTDTNNRNTAMTTLPVEVTVSSRVEVTTRFPDSLQTPPTKNGSNTSTCSLPSIDSRQPPKKRLEEVSGFVVVTKQNYFRPIRRKLQNQSQQKRSSEQEVYCVEDQKDDEQNNPISPVMRTHTGDSFTGTSAEDKIQLQIYDGKENESILVRRNEVYNSDFGRRSGDHHHFEGPPNKSQAVRTLPHKHCIGGRRKDYCNHKQDKKMQRISEGSVEELISPIKQSTVISSQDKICANDYVRESNVRALGNKSDVMKLDKIEAIEGWMKIYENEFFSERNKVFDKEETNSSVMKGVEHNTSVPMQGAYISVSHPTILSDTKEKAAEHVGIQSSANLFPSYVDVICAKQPQSLSQTVPEFSGSHPKRERSKMSPSMNRSQQHLDSAKHFLGKEELSFARTHHIEGQSNTVPTVIQEYISDKKQNWKSDSNLPENSCLVSSDNNQRANCPMQSNNASIERSSIEPICEAVRVTHQQSDSFQFKTKLGFKRCPPEAGSNAILEQIEAMIEPRTEEQPSREQHLKQRESMSACAKTEPIRTSCHSLMPDIVKVKMAIDNQSKILERLDLMMKHSEITNRSTYKTKDIDAVSVPCSEILKSLHEPDSEVGGAKSVSCRPFGSLSSSSSLKNVTDSELSGISEVRKPHTQCNEDRHCSKMPALENMNEARIIEQRLHDSPQCPSVKKITAGQNGRSGYRVLTGNAVGSGACLRHKMHLETTAVPSPLGIISTSSPPACHSAALAMNSTAQTITERSTVPCFVSHNLATYHSHDIPLSTSDIIMVTNTETLPHYATDFSEQSQENYSISLIPMSPRSETNSPYQQENAGRLRFQHIQNLKQEIKVEGGETYMALDFPVSNVDRCEYVGQINMAHNVNDNVLHPPANNGDGRQSCLDYITSLSGDTACVYEGNGPLVISPQFSNNQSQMLPPIGSISKQFEVQSEADMNVRNLSSSSLSTRRSSAKSTNVRAGRRALSTSPLADGFVDLTSLIRCSPTSLLGFSSSLCSQENGRQGGHGGYGHLSARESCSPLNFNDSQHAQEEGEATCAMTMRSLEQTCYPPYLDLSSNQIVLPQHENEMLAAIMGKTPTSCTQDAMVTLCALREDVAISTPPANTSTASTSQQLVTQSSDPFLGLLGNEDGGQQQTSPEQTEDDEAPGGNALECRWIDCYAVFPDQEALVHHIEKSHVELRKGEDFSCFWQGCPRRSRPFNARYKLLIHMRVHSGEKPNKCPFEGCTKAFSRLENLKIHQRSHTGERPYSCQYSGCTKAFSNSSDRAKHQRTHVDTKPYACQVEGCSKRYTDPSSLRKHVKNHTTKEQVQVRKKIRSEDKSGHIVPDTIQGAEHLRKQSVCSASREAAESSNSEQPSVKRYPASSSFCDHGTGYTSPSMQQGPQLEDLDYSSGFASSEPEILDQVLREVDVFPPASNLQDDILEYIPFDSVRRLLGEHVEYIDSALHEQLELESDIEQQFLELSNLERCSPSQFSSFQHD